MEEVRGSSPLSSTIYKAMKKNLLPKTKEALKKIDHMVLRDDKWRLLIVRLGSMSAYFHYAQRQVLDSEKQRLILSKNFNLSAPKFISYSIASYGHMKACSNFAKDISGSLAFKLQKYAAFLADLKTKRDRIEAHPNEKNGGKTILAYDSTIEKDGIRFSLWNKNLKKGEEKECITLTPKKDLMILSDLIEEISAEALRKYLANETLR